MRLAVRSAGTRDDAAWCYFHIGDLWLNSGRPERARAAYRMASSLAPGTANALNGLAKMAAAEGHLPAAIRRMERVIELNREPGYAIFLGDLYTANNQSTKASWAYELAGELEAAEETNGVNVNLESSLFAADHGEFAEALTRARAEYANRRSIHVADAYAWALYSQGRFHQAKRLSREAFRLGTRSPLFYFHAGMIHLALGREKRAGAALRTALQLNPGFSLIHAPTARRALVRLAQKG
jgi:tetratricopeptide (TPR) repeat protein